MNRRSGNRRKQNSREPGGAQVAHLFGAGNRSSRRASRYEHLVPLRERLQVLGRVFVDEARIPICNYLDQRSLVRDRELEGAFRPRKNEAQSLTLAQGLGETTGRN